MKKLYPLLLFITAFCSFLFYGLSLLNLVSLLIAAPLFFLVILAFFSYLNNRKRFSGFK
ncbi:hypothetical protein [Priestia endophytica]|uniref:hypothetical protein n=1 Tax=Priestia endophytica TaxID=135735 RepID=UPI00203F2AFF|nr:hypothetical protein [Priestia endophytica]MCM3536534.1 hypothetical protein [Priestia endophytica]